MKNVATRFPPTAVSPVETHAKTRWTILDMAERFLSEHGVEGRPQILGRKKNSRMSKVPLLVQLAQR